MTEVDESEVTQRCHLDLDETADGVPFVGRFDDIQTFVAQEGHQSVSRGFSDLRFDVLAFDGSEMDPF